MRWWCGYCFTRCTNTLVQQACIQSVSSSWHGESHFHEWHEVTRGKPAEGATSRCRGKAICLSGETGKCLFGPVGLTVSPVSAALQLSASEQMGTNLHLINPTSHPSQLLLKNSTFFPPRPPRPSESPRRFMPRYCLKPSSLKRPHFFLKSRTAGAVLTEWLIDMHFHSFQVWSAWLKRHDLDPWWAYGLKALGDCLAIPPL